MSTQYVGEIRIFAGNFAPIDWHFCDGSLLAISEYDVLYNLIGTTYGGDGQQTFALPNLQGRIPFHQGTDASGNTYVIGQSGGAETVTIGPNQLPAHSHALLANSGTGTQASPSGGAFAVSSLEMFSPVAPSTALSSQALGTIGGGQPHENRIPFLAVNFIIALFGVYPSQS
jgi:microcystin-dependent protein